MALRGLFAIIVLGVAIAAFNTFADAQEARLGLASGPP